MITVELEEIFEAYYSARENKRQRADAIAFEMEYEKRLIELYEELASGVYEISPSTAFIVNRPVKREIFAGAFRDRIVHHWVFNRLNPLCERVFIHDSYSCREGKGTSFGVRRAEHFVRSVSRNYSRDAWVLRLDISGYFMAIDRQVLFEKIETLLKKYTSICGFDRDFFLDIVRKIVFNDPTIKCRIRGKREDWVGLPKSKSLFFAKPGCGLPIGNLTSQLFANLYLNDFDHFVKRTFPKTRYGRYVDDLLFVSDDKDAFQEIPEILNAYLMQNLGLHMHPLKQYLQHISKGGDFLGKYILPYRKYLRNTTKQSVRDRLQKKRENDEDENYIELAQTWNSYRGLFDACNAYRIREKMFSEFCIDRVCEFRRKEVCHI